MDILKEFYMIIAEKWPESFKITLEDMSDK